MNPTHSGLIGAPDNPDLQAPTHVGHGVAITLAAAGILFVLYPAIRPFSDETSLAGAGAFASTSWIVAHTLAMAAFVLLTLGLLGLHLRLQATSVARWSLRGLVTSWVGAGLTLPFYGVETFGLAAIGQEVLDRGDSSLLEVAEALRLGTGLALLVAGLLLLAVGAVMVAAAIWKTQGRLRWSGIPLAIGLALYLPQFLASQPIRIGHGALMALGCLLLARTATTAATHTSEPRKP